MSMIDVFCLARKVILGYVSRIMHLMVSSYGDGANDGIRYPSSSSPQTLKHSAHEICCSGSVLS